MIVMLVGRRLLPNPTMEVSKSATLRALSGGTARWLWPGGRYGIAHAVVVEKLLPLLSTTPRHYDPNSSFSFGNGVIDTPTVRGAGAS